MLFFRPNVPKLLAKRDVPGLIRVLLNHDEPFSAEAAGALASLRDAAIYPLLEALQGQKKEVRIKVGRAIGSAGKPGIALLRRAYEYSYEEMRLIMPEHVLRGPHDVADLLQARAVELLGYTGKPDPELIRHLASLPADEFKYHLARPAALALEQLLGDRMEPPMAALCAVARQDWQRAVELGDCAVDPLIHQLRNRGKAEMGAIGALAKIGGPRVVQAFIQKLEREHRDLMHDDNLPNVNNSHFDDWNLILRSLGELGDRQAIPILEKCSCYGHTRREAGQALRKLASA